MRKILLAVTILVAILFVGYAVAQTPIPPDEHYVVKALIRVPLAEPEDAAHPIPEPAYQLVLVDYAGGQILTPEEARMVLDGWAQFGVPWKNPDEEGYLYRLPGVSIWAEPYDEYENPDDR